MSNVEDILMEAWDLGLNEIVMKKASAKHEELRNRGERSINMTLVYEESLAEAKKEKKLYGSRNR